MGVIDPGAAAIAADELARAKAYHESRKRRAAFDRARAARLRGSVAARNALEAAWAPWLPLNLTAAPSLPQSPVDGSVGATVTPEV